jgi:ABC-type transport system substrate-binding protein
MNGPQTSVSVSESRTTEINTQLSRRTLLKGSMLVGSALAGGVQLHTRLADASFQTPVAGGTIIIASGGDPSFDPYFLNSELRDVQGQIFRSLFDYRGDDPYEVNPALADSWEETDETLTVKLKEGVLFHNGRGAGCARQSGSSQRRIARAQLVGDFRAIGRLG